MKMRTTVRFYADTQDEAETYRRDIAASKWSIVEHQGRDWRILFVGPRAYPVPPAVATRDIGMVQSWAFDVRIEKD